jgi:8-amino-3,8-dideoxy-alpha-D-manno-octulosonate transaminase
LIYFKLLTTPNKPNKGNFAKNNIMPGYELIGAEERAQVNEVMETGVLMRYGFDGPRKGVWKSKELEQEICNYFGCEHAQLTSSGTAALTTAMAALGIGYGDEVIMPCYTFVASFEAVISVGAIPVLVDIDESLTLDIPSVENAITSKTKCIMPVHMCGSMAYLDELQAICKKHNIILLEDACQSIGGTYKGKKLGTIGAAGTFSFDYVKTMTCGEGGVVMTNDKQVYEFCDGYTDHGHDHKGKDRGADLHPFIGYNFRISELQAAIGLAQVKKIDTVLATQRKHHSLLKSILEKNIPEITFRIIPDPAGDSCSFLNWFLPTEAITAAAVAEMASEGLAGNFYWYANNWHYITKWDHLKNSITLNKLHPEHKAAIAAHATKNFAKSDAIISRCVSTSISLLWTEEQIIDKGNKMVAAIHRALKSQLQTA